MATKRGETMAALLTRLKKRRQQPYKPRFNRPLKDLRQVTFHLVTKNQTAEDRSYLVLKNGVEDLVQTGVRHYQNNPAHGQLRWVVVEEPDLFHNTYGFSIIDWVNHRYVWFADEHEKLWRQITVSTIHYTVAEVEAAARDWARHNEK